MSTHAILAVKHENRYFAKFVHYGAYADYANELNHASYDDCLDSVMSGASSEPFDGFYLDWDHVKELHWPADAFVDSMPTNCTKAFTTIDELKKFAIDNSATYIYIRNDDSLEVLCRTYDDRFIDEFEDINSIEEFNLDTFNALNYGEAQNALEEALEEIESLVDDPFIEQRLYTLFDKYDIHSNPHNLDEAREIAKRFNEALPEIKRVLRRQD